MISYKKYFSCLSPKFIKNRDGKIISVSCGKCHACLLKKQNRYTTLCNSASLSFKYTVFFTLTYDEKNVPICALHEGRSPENLFKIVGVDCTERPQKSVSHPKRFPHYNQQIFELKDCSYSDPSFKEFYKRATIRPSSGSPASCPSMPFAKRYLRYACPLDFRNFIKRLRFQAASKFDVSFSYFGVSEYGPRTFRPHFHGLLFFDDDHFAENVVDLVSKCWRFGASDTSFARRGGSCASYVASYCNSFATLPRFLNCEFIRPRSFHSFFLGSKVDKAVRDYIYDNPRTAFEPLTIPFNGSSYTYYPTAHAIGTLFPRCYNHDRQTDTSLSTLYNLYRDYRNYYGHDKCSELTKSALQLRPAFLRLLDIYPHKDCNYGNPRHLNIDLYVPGSDDAYSLSIYNRVFSAFCLSRRFMRLCSKRFPPTRVISLIKEYYILFSFRKLREFYESQIAYHEESNSTDYRLFYPVTPDINDLASSTDSYNTILFNNGFYKAYRDSVNFKVSERIKHKELNDANKIFC